MKKGFIPAVFEIARPVNVFISIASIFIAAFISGTIQPLINVIFACLSGGVIAAGANTINDYYDLEIDKVNKPNRPLVQGKLSREETLYISLMEFGIGVALAIFINLVALVIAVVISVLLILYSYRLKRQPLTGNFAVSFSTGMAFIYGGVAVDRILQTLIPAIFAFFYHFGREIIKDIQDIEGDTKENAKTFPIVYGKSLSLILTTINFLLLMVLIFLPYIFGWYGFKYFIIILLGVYPVIIYSVWSVWKNQSPKNLGFISNLLKADMIVGLLAIYMG